jgi:tetratricopeptide (TPR) repeat protein
MEAARTLVNLPAEYRQKIEPEFRQAFELALDEYKKSLFAENDRAGSHLMLGSLHEMLGDPERAKADYQAAITVEPNLAGSRSNLAALLEAEADRLQNQLRQAQTGGGMTVGQMKGILTQIQKLTERSSRLRGQDHGLLAKEIQRAEGIPGTHGLHYRFAMSSYLQRDLAAAEKHLSEAVRQQPDSPTYLMGLATYYLHVEKPDEAIKSIEQLIRLDDQHPGYQALKAQAQQQLQAKGQESGVDVEGK